MRAARPDVGGGGRMTGEMMDGRGGVRIGFTSNLIGETA